ncbi:MAG: Fur family transcriptional regulator [Clostridiaceae bacterium]
MGLKEVLNNKGIRATKGRIQILEILSENNKIETADSLFEKMNKENYCIDLSTVYRTLEIFNENGLVDKFDIGDGKYNYKLKENSHKHTIKCCNCSKEIQIDCPMYAIEELIRNKTGFTLVEHELNVKAICEKCSEKGE